MNATRWERIALFLLVIVVAAAVRLWGLPSYSPHFWDEAKYLSEVEGVIPYFSVNAAAFAILKLGHAVVGAPWYPQLVTALLGVLTIVGLYLLGTHLLSRRREGVALGLLMAGQAAIMPYFLQYARHALAAGFALCFFVYAILLYLMRLQYPRLRKPKNQTRYLGLAAASSGLLALVPASSFNLMVPTVVLFVILEVLVWRQRPIAKGENKSRTGLAAMLMIGLALFIVIPPLIAAVSGYSGWLERAIALFQSHAERRTMRPAFHFLFPVHFYYLAGPLFILVVLAGLAIWFTRRSTDKRIAVNAGGNQVMAASGLVYLLFFGFFSHQQSARLYALTLPCAVYAASFFFLWLYHVRSRLGRLAAGALGLLLMATLGQKTLDYLSRTSVFRQTCDVVMQQMTSKGTAWTSAGALLSYFGGTSRYNRGVPVDIKPMLRPGEPVYDSSSQTAVIIADGMDVVMVVIQYDKWDGLAGLGPDDFASLLANFQPRRRSGNPVYAGHEDFHTSPYYYTEDLYSWRSYRIISELMPYARDSVYIHVFAPRMSDRH